VAQAASYVVLTLKCRQRILHIMPSKQDDIEATKTILGQYNNYRITYLPFLFSVPLSALAYKLLPQAIDHRTALALLFGFGLGIPFGELGRFIWLRVSKQLRS
jgi:hypothetical protein